MELVFRPEGDGLASFSQSHKTFRHSFNFAQGHPERLKGVEG